MLLESFIYEENPNLLNITLNRKLYRQVTKSLFQKQLNLPKEFTTKKEVDLWFYELEVKLAKNYVYFLLSLKNYPSAILKQKLLDKGIQNKVIILVLKELVRKQIVNDEEWIKHFIHKEFSRGWGPFVIAQKIKQKKLYFEDLPQLIDQYIPMQKQKEKIYGYIKKTHHTKEKIMMDLLRKGFSSELIKEVFFLTNKGER